MLPGSRASVGKKRDASNSLLEDLARAYAIPLKLYFSRRVRNQSDVPDLVQDVLLRLSKTSNLTSVSKPENYLFTTAASALRDKARRDSVRYRDQHITFEVGKHSGSDFSPERICAGREALVALQGALKSLPERTRDVFVLRVFEEQKTAAVAEALKLSTRAVEMHYAKALAQVAAVLSEYRYE